MLDRHTIPMQHCGFLLYETLAFQCELHESCMGVGYRYFKTLKEAFTQIAHHIRILYKIVCLHILHLNFVFYDLACLVFFYFYVFYIKLTKL